MTRKTPVPWRRGLELLARRSRCGRCSGWRRRRRCSGRRSGWRRRGLGLRGRIDPAGVDPAIEGFGNLRVNGRAEPDHAAERRLDMAAGAAEPLIEVQMAERGIEIVAPHQADHAPSQPDAFRVSGRTVDGLRRFHEFIGLALAFLGRIARRLFGSVVLGPEIATLGDSGPDSDKEGEGRNGNPLENRDSKPVTNPTHEIPDEWRANRQRSAPTRCPAIAAEDCLYRNCLIPMKDIYVFVQQGRSPMRHG